VQKGRKIRTLEKKRSVKVGKDEEKNKEKNKERFCGLRVVGRRDNFKRRWAVEMVSLRGERGA